MKTPPKKKPKKDVPTSAGKLTAERDGSCGAGILLDPPSYGRTERTRRMAPTFASIVKIDSTEPVTMSANAMGKQRATE